MKIFVMTHSCGSQMSVSGIQVLVSQYMEWGSFVRHLTLDVQPWKFAELCVPLEEQKGKSHLRQLVLLPVQLEKYFSFTVVLCWDLLLHALLRPWFWPLVACGLCFIDLSWVYHLIRANSLVKVFILFNMLFVFERIIASFTVDLQRSWSISYLFCLAIHSLVLLLQLVTLSASLNANDASFIAVITSTNFLEVRESVLKRFSASNLFQISCSDVVERIHMIWMSVMVILLQIAFDQTINAQWTSYALMCLFFLVLFEPVIDWTRHFFIVRFNDIDVSVYGSFNYIVRKDFIKAHLDSCHEFVLLQRLGFCPEPLLAIVFLD